MTAKNTKPRPLSNEEEARIQKLIGSDPDAPEATDAQLAKAGPFAEVFPELADTMRKNLGGRPKSENPKRAVSIRLDNDVLEKFKATGPGWQSRMNEVLRKAKV
ncbi:BrnA antitoxin family protein [Roseiarcaceae bacterium H3SJ34-1]|uniref:BrnA antitoxin family protein n=1 Tax=Terripilifer ovatus TaxID=3032367 RepID=UPI003AB9A12E|nr:BrnA antitoxin family protein [Roseiarcaceae bacterium H3SJ34-1]